MLKINRRKRNVRILFYLALGGRKVEEDGEIEELNGQTSDINSDHKKAIWMDYW